jgi:isocitrate dehydrogenase
MMLVHLRQPQTATVVHNAWLRTIEDGIHTADLVGESTRRPVGTRGFAAAVIDRLGDGPCKLKPVEYRNPDPPAAPAVSISTRRPPATKATVGVDLFIHDGSTTPDTLGQGLSASATPALELQMITNRGVKVWPNGFSETFCTDHWRCRFVARREGGRIVHKDIIELLERITEAGFDVIKTENLCTFDGVAGYTLGQGQ